LAAEQINDMKWVQSSFRDVFIVHGYDCPFLGDRMVKDVVAAGNVVYDKPLGREKPDNPPGCDVR